MHDFCSELIKHSEPFKHRASDDLSRGIARGSAHSTVANRIEKIAGQWTGRSDKPGHDAEVWR